MSKVTQYRDGWGRVTAIEVDGVGWSPVEGRCKDCAKMCEYGRKLLCVREKKAHKVKPLSWCRKFEEAADE